MEFQYQSTDDTVRVEVSGRLDGMNERGLAVGLHLVKARPRFPGLTSTLLVRRVLDSCATTAEAIDLLRRLPHAMKYNYSMLDAEDIRQALDYAKTSGLVVSAPMRKPRPNHQRTLRVLRAMTPEQRLDQVFKLNTRALELFRRSDAITSRDIEALFGISQRAARNQKAADGEEHRHQDNLQRPSRAVPISLS